VHHVLDPGEVLNLPPKQDNWRANFYGNDIKKGGKYKYKRGRLNGLGLFVGVANLSQSKPLDSWGQILPVPLRILQKSPSRTITEA